MRKVIAVELVSLDGVMERPEEWAFSYSDDEMEEANAAGMSASDALLLGRVTYEGMAAFWPNQPGGTPMVDYINSVSKFVASGTLGEPLGWNNSLLADGLLDELRLMVHPVVLSSGKRHFEAGGDRKALELLDSKTFGTGVVYLAYQPAQS
jgi:dihydrofolate reductase